MEKISCRVSIDLRYQKTDYAKGVLDGVQKELSSLSYLDENKVEEFVNYGPCWRLSANGEDDEGKEYDKLVEIAETIEEEFCTSIKLQAEIIDPKSRTFGLLLTDRNR